MRGFFFVSFAFAPHRPKNLLVRSHNTDTGSGRLRMRLSGLSAASERAGVIRAGAHMVQPRLRHPLIPIRPVPSERLARLFDIMPLEHQQSVFLDRNVDILRFLIEVIRERCAFYTTAYQLPS